MDAKKKTFIEALHDSFGNISKACSVCGINRGTYYNWMGSDEDFKNHVDSIDEYILDTVESCLKGQINEGNTVATIFYLKTKGKKRGYVERSEVDNMGSLNLNVSVSPQEAKEISNSLDDKY